MGGAGAGAGRGVAPRGRGLKHLPDLHERLWNERGPEGWSSRLTHTEVETGKRVRGGVGGAVLGCPACPESGELLA